MTRQCMRSYSYGSATLTVVRWVYNSLESILIRAQQLYISMHQL